MASPQRGHREHPHVADVILEAWGRDLAACFEEAIAALVGVCFDGARAEVVGSYDFAIAPGTDGAMLLDVLDEVLFVIDTADDVPIGATLAERGGSLAATLQLADRGSVEVIGSVPKAISRSASLVEHVDDQVRCRFLVDV